MVNEWGLTDGVVAWVKDNVSKFDRYLANK
jgi:hypothetical protein